MTTYTPAIFKTERVSIPFCLFSLAFLVYGYFYGGGTWNQNARLDAVFAFVEPGTPDYLTFRIDRFVLDPQGGFNTGDWAHYGAHYFANKAPGTPILGALFYAPLYHLERWLGLPVSHPLIEIANAYLINLWVSVFFAAAGIVCFYHLLRVRGMNAQDGVLFTAVLAFGSLLFPFSTQLWGHATAAAFEIMALAALQSRTRCAWLAAGAAAGAAVLCDYLAALVLLPLLMYALCSGRRLGGWFLLGGLPLAVLHMWYHYACFGSVLALATDYNNPVFLEAGRFKGLWGALDWHALWQLTFGLDRGLFVSMPVLLLAAPGAACWYKRSRRDPWFWVSAFVVIAVLAANASYQGWQGGDAVAPRYQILALPFWLLLITQMPSGRNWRRLLLALFSWSVLNMTAIATVSPVLVTWQANPLYAWIYPKFLSSSFPAYYLPIRLHLHHPLWPQIAPCSVWNLGSLLGLKGLWSLMPLVVAVTLLIALLNLRLDGERAPGQRPPEDGAAACRK